MMHSIFSRSEATKRSMFTEDDIRKLIQTFPPPEPRPGKESLVRSLSGNHLVRSDAVVKKFRSLLQNATGPVFLNGLNTELGVQDVQWILVQEEDRVFFTKDRTRLLSEGVQKGVVGQLRSALEEGGVRLEEVANDIDITVSTLLRVVAAQDTTLALEELEDGQTYSVAFLERTERELLEILRDATSAIVLGDEFPQVPAVWLETVAPEIVARNGDSVKGVVEKGTSGLRFTPQSKLVQLESEFKQAQDAYTRKAVEDLTTIGYFNISPSVRPDILRESSKAGNLDFSQSIQEAFAEKGSEESLVELEAQNQDGNHIFLIRQDTLSSKTAEVSQLAQETATKLWDKRTPGEEVPFNSDTTDVLSSLSPDPILTLAILSYPLSSTSIREAYTSRLQQLSSETQSNFTSTLQIQLLAPLALYTQGTTTITDETLQTRLKDFIHTLFRTDILPTLTSTLRAQNLLPTTKPSLRDFEKFLDAAQASKTLDELNNAVAKMVRKLRLENPNAKMLAEIKLQVLEGKVRQMKRMKRVSDLLQNFVWVALAGTAEGLFVSAGRDTTRMVRVCRGMVEEELGTWVEGVRGRAKEGSETEEDREGLRREAAKVVEGLKGGRLVEKDTADGSNEVDGARPE